MTRMRALAPLLLLAGCVGDDVPGRPAARRRPPSTSGARTAGTPRTCLPFPLGSGSFQPVNARTLKIRRGGTIWVNRLAADSPKLRPFNTVIVEKKCAAAGIAGATLSTRFVRAISF